MEVVVVIGGRLLRVPNVLEVVFLYKGVISVSLAAAVSGVTQLLMVEEWVHGTGALWTSVGAPLLVVTQLSMVVVEE